jgi:beta-galactosidase
MKAVKLVNTAMILGSVLALSACSNDESSKPSALHKPQSNTVMPQDVSSTLTNIIHTRQKISANWQYLENATADVVFVKQSSDWEAISLPHTWNADDTTDVITGYRRDASWYAKHVSLDLIPTERYFLHFEAAQMKASVYVNGEKAGDHVGGYISFDIEITDHVVSGKNEILVRVDNGVDKDLVPSQKADFFQYGGLTRDVWLLTTPQNRLKQVQVSTPEVSKEQAHITLKPITDTLKDFNAAHFRTRITAPNGETVASGEALEYKISEPALWSPDTPQLYTIYTDMLDSDGEVVDSFSDTFGLRWFEFKANGPFYLNGERLLLRGTHLHEGHAGYGSAMTDEQRISDLTAIKELGANFVRLGHYSHDPVIYDTADKLGIILYDEVPWNRGGVGGEKWRENTQAMTRRMIEQNYNRASVFLWSLGNEMYWLPDVEGGGDKARVAEELQLLHNIAKEIDPGRLTTIRKFPEGADIVDVYSPSIWAGWYGGGYVQYQEAIEMARAEHPYLLHMEYGGSSHVGRFLDKPFGRFGTSDPENLGSVEEAVNQTGVISVAKSKVWDMSYMIDLFDWYLRISETDPNFAGSAQWAFKDFGTPIRPENPLPFVNMKGLMQRDGIKKDVYHVFASYWQQTPTCWIESPSWNYRVGKKDEIKTISVFCNTHSAQLSLNGKALDTKKRDISQYPASGLTWDLVFEEGKNTLAVEGFDAQGNVVAEHGYDLTYNTNRIGKMVDIILTTIDNGDGSLTLFAEAQDKAGNRVVSMNDRGYFTIDGGGRFLQDQGTPTGSQTREFANGTSSIIVYPGATESVVNIQTQDYRGYYITIPASMLAEEL